MTMKALTVAAEWKPRAGYALSPRERSTGIAMDGSQVWRNPSWSLAERAMPAITAPDELLIRVRACGVCGSDLHMWETDDEGYILLAYHTRFPSVLGHEFSGEVVEVGDGVTRFEPGDAVTCEEINYCGDCRACRVGLFNQCELAIDIGFTVDGAYADYIVVRERFCWGLNGLRELYPDERVYEIGSLVEPTSVAYEAMFKRAGGFPPGGHVAVFGCGPIGLAAVHLARAAGAARIVAFDVQEGRRAVAERGGADWALDPRALAHAGSSPADEVMALTGGEGVAMAVEASGAYGAVLPAIEECLDFGGKVAVVGIDAAAAPVSFAKYMVRAGSIYAGLGHCGGNFGRVIALHQAQRIDMSAIVTARFGLDDGLAAIEKTLERTDAKVLVKP